ncbi:MAG: nuclear transport factor 2 family protein, partial [bacterium]|nr:nuclear transport factor 2 family protein [bacterium]
MKLSRRVLEIGSLAFLLPLCLATAFGSNTDSEKRKQVEDAGRAWEKATETKDVAALKQILADDCLFVLNDGRSMNKQQIIQYVTGPRQTIHSNKSEDNVFRMYDDVAVVTGRATQIATVEGQEHSVQLRYVAVWKLTNSRW